LDIYVVVVKRRRNMSGQTLQSERVRRGDFDHPQRANRRLTSHAVRLFFYKKLQGQWDSMTSVTIVVVNDILIAENRDVS